MKTLTATLMALALAGPALAADAQKAPEPAKPVDAANFFNGRWYEIGRTPMKLTDGCVAGYTDYLRKGDKVTQRDGCRDQTPTGKEKVIGGPLKILNPGQNTKVHVSYQLFGFVPIAREYWMIDHTNEWFLQSTPNMDMINIYTRDPHPSAELVEKLTAEVKSWGYTGALEFPELAAK
ncbi:lipocalin family protein [Phenylobacterium sp.]|uniref:lipocalin family protein n=1 Tax=Phenylobacterium sp. TaxID=1871053 RepID=UPI0025E6A313|nr:lipocalin family protein [Phenylobacterium sp.]